MSSLSGALTRAAPLKAEIRLAQAVSEFEADLPTETKVAFQASRDHAIASPPTIACVMELTAEINRGSTGRCFGTRFTRALESIQQFAAIGDIIIGGSQNIVACSVWTLVRTTLLAVVRFTTYLESLSELFLNVGRSAPRYSEMAALYPRSKTLQSDLSEYFIVVVQLCHRVYSLCHSSVLGQFKMALGNLNISTYQADLERWAKSIKEQLGVEEARETSVSRSLLQKLSKREEKKSKLAHRQRVLDACTRHNYQAGWKLARKAGSTKWLFKTKEYLTWKSQPQASVLVISGKLGAGKTVLFANMVDDLTLKAGKHAVAYFFCRQDEVDSLQTRVILGSLAHQLIAALTSIEVSTAQAKKIESSDLQGIMSLLRYLTQGTERVYFVLDGVDECSKAQRSILINCLIDLQKSERLYLCISHRFEAERRVQEDLGMLERVTDMLLPKDNEDIIDFIQLKLEMSLESGDLALGDPTLIFDIQDALRTGAQGMFLWVALQIDAVCSQKTDNDIRTAIADLPADLPSTFSRILQRARPSAPNHQMRLLKLLTVAIRPLTLDELRDALSVVPLRTTYDAGQLINDIGSVLASCGSLLIVDEEQSTVHFVHPSVRQFLLASKGNKTEFQFELDEAEIEMRQVLLTYLNYNVFENQVSTTVVPTMSATDAPTKIIASSLSQSSHTQSIALQLLRRRKRTNFDMGRALTSHSDTIKTQTNQEFYLYSYAKKHWIAHSQFLSGNETAVFAMWRQLLSNPSYGGIFASMSRESPIMSANSFSDSLEVERSLNYAYTASLASRRSRTVQRVPFLLHALRISHLGLLSYLVRSRSWGIRALVCIIPALRWLRVMLPTFRIHPQLCIRLMPLIRLYGDGTLSKWLREVCSSEAGGVETHGCKANVSNVNQSEADKLKQIRFWEEVGFL